MGQAGVDQSTPHHRRVARWSGDRGGRVVERRFCGPRPHRPGRPRPRRRHRPLGVASEILRNLRGQVLDYQAIIIAVLSSAALTKTIDFASSRAPEARRLRKQLVSWQEWALTVRKHVLEDGGSTEDWPNEPESE